MLKKVIITLCLVYLVLGPGLALSAADTCKDYCDELEAGGNPSMPKDQVCYCSPLTYTSITEIIDSVIGWILWVALIVAPVMVIIGGLMFLMAGGNPGMVSTGKKILLWTIIGFLFILFSKGVFSLIQSVLGV